MSFLRSPRESLCPLPSPTASSEENTLSKGGGKNSSKQAYSSDFYLPRGRVYAQFISRDKEMSLLLLSTHRRQTSVGESDTEG